ncbi:MAG: glyoxalase [Marinilabiliales bacterium]|nr:MAG: glyoxalase [Marinilabiliales bacterium]
MDNKVIISGIQQVGIGIPNLAEAFGWYNKYLGFDARIFDDEGVAELMLPYTGGKPQQRRAILAMNMRGGGGLEIWQPKGREQRKPEKQILLGDLGLYVAKYKAGDAQKAYEELKNKGADLLSEVMTSPAGVKHFFLKDLNDNILQIEEDAYRFHDPKKNIGGVNGLIIGVSDMERSVKFYGDALGYDTVVNDSEGVFDDFAALPGGAHKVRRVLLSRSETPKGAFAPIFGTSVIELVQAFDYTPVKIFENRWWGDAGYIHVCFDIQGMKALQNRCEALGHPFVCDSNDSFDMGEAAGHFTYVEDPDGALIEFVETHKVPVMKKLGWYIDLRKRNPEKPLPSWMLKAIGLKREKA